MKRTLIITCILLLAALLTAGCISEQKIQTPVAGPDSLNAQAGVEFANANYRAATNLYTLAYQNYAAGGNTAAALQARNKAFTAQRMTIEFDLNRTEVEQAVEEAFPSISAEQKAGWLLDNRTIRIRSDSEELYFSDTVGNIPFHETALMQKQTAVMKKTPLYDSLTPVVLASPVTTTGPYGKPVTWEGTETLSLPRKELPNNGTLRLWVPAPIESGSQANVTVFSIKPSKYVVTPPDTHADLGLVYMEIPLEQESGDFVNVSVGFWYTQAEQRFAIDPAKVKTYNKSDAEYRKYTAAGKNIVITPEMKKKAMEIVGNETNPYLQARLIYWHIMDTLPYSHVPHIWLETSGTPESSFVLNTGFGDCGSQSMYFAALCRSLGIPARAVGGYQLIPGGEGPHFWAEYYLEGYGWIPVDVTAAETADWSYNATPDERYRFREYYFGSLDPYRYIIQKDVDIPITPDPGNAVLFRMVVQSPKVICDTCPEDLDLFLQANWKVDVKKV
ncbi:MAG: transglutaminase domain-containing protein [Methanoregula sp.]|nr:transglutaminase domain-containing protein [Methanoregula sp.]